MERQPCVYLLARGSHSTLYTGVTSNLLGRIQQHRSGEVPSFTRRYGIKRLVWFEAHESMESAILREKRIKRWPRAWKYALIHAANPDMARSCPGVRVRAFAVEVKVDPGARPGRRVTSVVMPT
ncbi:MAG: GIY-YIG nuclease family protein [Sphingomicrobium sp.]